MSGLHQEHLCLVVDVFVSLVVFHLFVVVFRLFVVVLLLFVVVFNIFGGHSVSVCCRLWSFCVFVAVLSHSIISLWSVCFSVCHHFALHLDVSLFFIFRVILHLCGCC